VRQRDPNHLPKAGAPSFLAEQGAAFDYITVQPYIRSL